MNKLKLGVMLNVLIKNKYIIWIENSLLLFIFFLCGYFIPIVTEISNTTIITVLVVFIVFLQIILGLKS
ncbi:MAG: hypothetical protein ACFFKA_17915, partial [Candidatus Thorarchaeota archaeon]